MIEITMQEILEIAAKDLLRLGKKHEISIEAKSEFCQVLWECRIECAKDYLDFKTSYLEFDKDLQKWLDNQRWLHKVSFSDCWLALTISGGSVKFVVCKSA